MKSNFKLLFAGFIVSSMLISCNTKENIMEDKALLMEDLDITVRPQDNFYQYATGGWQKNHPLPQEESRFGSFDLLGKSTSQKVKSLIVELADGEHPEGSLEWKIGNFYSVGMDSATIETLGIKPLLPEIEKIDAIDSKAGIIKQFAYNNKIGLSSLFYFFGSADADNSDMQIAHILQGGLGLPDRDYYTAEDNRSKEIRAEYLRFLANMFSLMGDNVEIAEANAARVMDIEMRLAKASMTRLQQRDPHATNNKMSLVDLNDLSGSFDFDTYLCEIGMEKIDTINVRQPKFFTLLGTMMDDVSVDDWKTYLRWKLIGSSASMLNSDFDNLQFEFYDKFLRGQGKQKPRWRRIVSATNGALGEAVGQKFVEKHFPPEAKERMITLVENLRTSFSERIAKSTWMSAETQEKAQKKLAGMVVKIGYPDKWRDYSDLEVTNSYVQNMLNSNRFDFEYMLSKIGKPVDKEEWHMNPQIVNAYYSPVTNEICFPAGILQAPFFYMGADDAVNYGAIGVVIGHEMTHGFDDQGRNFDKNGNLKNWWTAHDIEKFNVQSKILIDRYNDIFVLDTMRADGNLSLGENIADFGGLTIAYNAFRKSLEGKDEPIKINGFTADQRFFLAYAKVWAQNITDQEIMRRIKEDVHSLGEWRVNGQVPGIKAFHDAFDVQPGDSMYLPEAAWTKIW
ncbi:MAG: M13 family metallopeptidase [Bacteroidota bacterium]|nr:M13 family metallopeptidase [Bacteroidota bacterium]